MKNLHFSGIFFILSKSSIAFGGPVVIESSKSGRFSSVHGSGGSVVFNDGVIVINVRFKDTFSGNGVVSLRGESSKFVGPSSDSGVF
jgi:hypothetical protein